MSFDEAMAYAARLLDERAKRAMFEACEQAVREGGTAREVEELSERFGKKLAQWRAESLADIRKKVASTLIRNNASLH